MDKSDTDSLRESLQTVKFCCWLFLVLVFGIVLLFTLDLKSSPIPASSISTTMKTPVTVTLRLSFNATNTENSTMRVSWNVTEAENSTRTFSWNDTTDANNSSNTVSLLEPDEKPETFNAQALVFDLFNDGNHTIDPCENFYEFACQEWYLNNPPPPNTTFRWNAKSALEYQTAIIVADILQQPLAEDDIPAFALAQKFYQNCLDFNPCTDEVKNLSALTDDILHKYPQHVRCAMVAQNFFDLAVAQKYLQRKYKNNDELASVFTEVDDMSVNIEESLRGLQNRSQEEGFKYRFEVEKLDKINACLGIPSWIFNNTMVQQEYKGMHLDQPTFRDQVTYLHSTIVAKNFIRKVNECFADEICIWRFSPVTNPLLDFFLPMDRFQPKFFELGQPMGFKYGHLGFSIAQMLVQACTENNFFGTTVTEECLKQQYGNFTVNELLKENTFLDGRYTLGENLSDLRALTGAYYAYKQAEQMKTSEQSEENSKTHEFTSYTEDQLFFLGFAQNYCEVPSLKYLKEDIQTKKHSPSMFRVLGTLQNSKEFATAWNCPVGSKMNPNDSTHTKCNPFP